MIGSLAKTLMKIASKHPSVSRALPSSMRVPRSQTIPSSGLFSNQRGLWHEYEPTAALTMSKSASNTIPVSGGQTSLPKAFRLGGYGKIPRYDPQNPFNAVDDVDTALSQHRQHLFNFWDPEPPTLRALNLTTNRTHPIDQLVSVPKPSITAPFQQSLSDTSKHSLRGMNVQSAYNPLPNVPPWAPFEVWKDTTYGSGRIRRWPKSYDLPFNGGY